MGPNAYLGGQDHVPGRSPTFADRNFVVRHLNLVWICATAFHSTGAGAHVNFVIRSTIQHDKMYARAMSFRPHDFRPMFSSKR